jgi:RHS repeat-associated protein
MDVDEQTAAATAESLNYTAQRLDGTGLLYYHARYYDPTLARFVSADSVVPGDASGGMDGVALKPLTVDFHEVGLVGSLNGENKQPFHFQMSQEQRQRAGNPWGPANAQALNRYAYVQNNPLKYTDQTGHAGSTLHDNGDITIHMTHEEAVWLSEIINGKQVAAAEAAAWLAKFALGKYAAVALGSLLVSEAVPLMWIAGEALALADQHWGEKGLDIRFSSSSQFRSVGAPTVERQHGQYFDPVVEAALRPKPYVNPNPPKRYLCTRNTPYGPQGGPC